MAKSAWQYYAVKLIYQAVIIGEPIPERIDECYSNTHTFFEESIVLVHAQSFEHAYSIAERKARANERTHTNPYGQTVMWKLIDAIDCYWIDDKISNGIELYSSFTPKEKGITPSEYLMRQYGYNMDDYDWNDQQKEKQIRLQTVLTYEEFSKWRKDSSHGN